MPLPRGPRFPSVPPRPPSPGNDHPILGVGSRVMVTCRGSRSGRVALTDASGTSAVASVPDGAEVEILAWYPRRGGETRYRVVPTKGGVEGWLGASCLRPRRPVVAPKVAAPPAAAPAVRLVVPARAVAAATAAPVTKRVARPAKSARKGAR